MIDELSTEAVDAYIQAIAESKQEEILSALHDGYDGIDFLQIPDSPRDSIPVSVSYQMLPWCAPPPEWPPMSGVERYDFRYYDEENLCYMLKTGKYPEDL